MVRRCRESKEGVEMVKNMREGVTQQASNNLTGALGNTLNGPQAINGVSPEQLKQNAATLRDILGQSNVATNSPVTAAPPPPNPVDAKEAKTTAVNALLGTSDTPLNLDQVGDEQLDALLQNATLLNGQQ